MALQALGYLGIARPGALLAPGARAALRAALQAGAPAAVKTRALANLAELLKARRGPERILERRAAAALVSTARPTKPAFAGRRGREALSVCCMGRTAQAVPHARRRCPVARRPKRSAWPARSAAMAAARRAPARASRARAGPARAAARGAPRRRCRRRTARATACPSPAASCRRARPGSAARGHSSSCRLSEMVPPASAHQCEPANCTCGIRPKRSTRLAISQAPALAPVLR